ncbi:acetate--CoA ligase family protein [Methanolacinia petrolearia]|uniref:acetate--CoA ligase family protein n=1 Tax=Methanolacinia petrolearia TaxID=54120 RepID=UPI003BACC680
MKKKVLLGAEGYRLLDRFGIPHPKYGLAHSEDEAAGIAENLGFPVVMKVISPDIIHKSDAGGVVLDIGSAGEAREAYSRIIRNSLSAVPGALIEGVIVEKSARPGLEILVGGKTDPAFGKTLTFGTGGTNVSIYKDVSFAILPLTPEKAKKMIRGISAFPLIRGYRGSKPKDEAEMVRILVNAARMFGETPGLSEFDINPLRLYEEGACAIDTAFIFDESTVPAAQVVRGENAPADTGIFSPSSIALVGASEKPGKVGTTMAEKLAKFPGEFYPVNPTDDEIFGFKCYQSVMDIPGSVDMAVISVPAPLVPGIAKECGEKCVKIAVIISAGFRETGEEGAKIEDIITETGKKYGMRIVGPNCLGLISPCKGYDTTFLPITPLPGNIAFISQSGALLNAVIDWSLSYGLGYSLVASVGNQCDLKFTDYLVWAQSDENTRAIIMYIEDVGDGRRFMELVSEISPEKPVVVIKAGSSDKGHLAAASHTGSLAGSHEIYIEAFKECGAISASSIEDAFYSAEFLAHRKRYPKGGRVVVLTNAGGFAVLASDYAEKYGLNIIDLPTDVKEKFDGFLPSYWSRRNPVDIVGDARMDRFVAALDLLCKNEDFWDICVVISIPSNNIPFEQLAGEIIKKTKETEKRLVPVFVGGEEMKQGRDTLTSAGIPSFDEPETAFRVMGGIVESRHVSGDLQ